MHQRDQYRRAVSVRPFVTFVNCVKTSNHSHTILLLRYQALWQYSDGDPLTEATSSFAVAKRPRDASYLSVVSFNSTKRRVESFTVSYVGYRFITACS